MTRQEPESKRRPRGRPPGRTAQGLESRNRLYDIAVDLISSRGYERTTLRDIAAEAKVSVGLLYRYFPSKRAVVLTVYDDLSIAFVSRATPLPTGRWRERFMYALRTSLQTIGKRRSTLTALAPVLIGDREEGVFAPATSFSRLRVQAVFAEAVSGASDAPKAKLAGPLGRLLYLAHLGVILLWLLDKSRGQRATKALVGSLERALPVAALVLRMPAARAFIVAMDAAFREALFESPDQGI